MADLHVPGLRAQLQAHLGSLHLAAQFDVPHGTLVVLGPNGAGKSSLLRCLLGAVAVQRAQIQVQGRWLHHTQLGIELPLEQRGLGYVPQSYALFAHLSVSQHLHFALQCAGVRSRLARDQRVERFLIELNLTHLGQRRPAQLSGGERQRVALARALCSQPSALLLDEPLAALDVEQRAHVRSFLADYLRQLQLPCVLVTHDPEDAIALSTGGCLVLEDGQVTQRGTWNDLALTPASAFVTRFVSALAQTDA